jgi:hypothetical protein
MKKGAKRAQKRASKRAGVNNPVVFIELKLAHTLSLLQPVPQIQNEKLILAHIPSVGR